MLTHQTSRTNLESTALVVAESSAVATNVVDSPVSSIVLTSDFRDMCTADCAYVFCIVSFVFGSGRIL